MTESNGDAEPAPKATPASRTVSASGRYTVKKGDTLSEIAQAHGITTARLRSLNGLKTTRIRVGQTLKVR